MFTHYRVGRQGSLLTDAKNLPKRFKGLAAAQRRLAKLSASGAVDAETYAVMENAAADVFWPQARTAAVKDAAIRKACLPYIQQPAAIVCLRHRGKDPPGLAGCSKS